MNTLCGYDESQVTFMNKLVIISNIDFQLRCEYPMFCKYLGAVYGKIYSCVHSDLTKQFIMTFDEPIFMLQARVLYVMCDQIGAPVYNIDRFYKMCA